MKILLQRTGGFAGMTRSVEIDVDALSEDERRVATSLIQDADFFALPSLIPQNDQHGADLYSYRITIESDDGAHTVDVTQMSVPDSLSPLIDWLDRKLQE